MEFNLSLARHLVRSISLISLTAIASVVGFSYLVHSNPMSSTSASMKGSLPSPAIDIPKSTVKGEQTLVLAGGCFWGVEAVFEHLKGVSNVVSGYSGEVQVRLNTKELVLDKLDMQRLSKLLTTRQRFPYGQLLKVYFSVAHDPTQLNRQGPDIGSQYRSAIFFSNPEQKRVAQAYIQQLNQAHVFSKAIVTQLTPLNGFYAAEGYHQNFIAKNPNYPYVVIHDLPKLNQLKQQFASLYQN